jgi:putative DNA primase/helicase
MITARNLYQEPFDFPPTHKTFLTTNHRPIVRDTDEGIWRRIHLIPFTTTIAKANRDRHYREKKLLPELPGILNWALEGLRSYWKEGLDPPREVMHATQEYREDMDIVGRWIEERCVREADAKVAMASLHHDYKRWAEEEVGFSMSAIKFAREMVARGFPRTRTTDGNKGIQGLQLLPRPRECE